MTLVEMMIAIAIFTMGIAGFTTLFSGSLKQNTYVLEMGQTVTTVSRSITSTAKYIREARQGDNGAYPVVFADDNELIFYGDYDKDGVTERLHLYKSGTDIILGIREPNSTFPVTYASGDGSTEVIASHVVNEVSDAIFAYYGADYPEDSINNPIATPATVPDVRLVRITLFVNIDPNHAPDNVRIQTFAEMRNLNDHDRFGI